ncbi:hypothetical protein KPH14_001716 [Odynerus spinipes]|uniref:Uncharacterized protein n=1 Tax=Odynerus spinipes TaxID=1348599 RepID=A0AAD9S1D5_9HYME|nr:hypothetical protein KPH14_001716 [Odynerus spinipes]
MSEGGTSTPKSFFRLKQVEEGLGPRNRLRQRKNLIKRGTQATRRNITRTRYYFTSGHEHLGDARNVNEEQSPFAFPSCPHLFAYFQFWKAQRRIAIHKKHETSKTLLRPRHDILRRLRVDVEIEKQEAKKHKELKEAIAITDVNPEYFVESIGTAVKEKFSLRRYVDDLREILRSKLLAGDQRDLCIHIEQQFDEERRRLNRIKN